MRVYSDELYHHGVEGMKWGVRNEYKPTGRRSNKIQNDISKVTSKLERSIYDIGVRFAPREIKYKFNRILNSVDEKTKILCNAAQTLAKQNGILVTNKDSLRAIEKVGIEKHKKSIYNNLNDIDIERLKTYTNSARYSRGINGYLAIGEPRAYEKEAAQLKETLSKNKIKDQTFYRSCNLKFSVNGVAKKLDHMTEEELSETISKMSKNFKGKSIKENRVFSTSTSPLFAIDTWREVNPTAASTYNTYMIINAKNCNGVMADGRTSDGKTLVNTRSNQEGILAPDKLVYRNLTYDKKRKMFAITVDAM